MCLRDAKWKIPAIMLSVFSVLPASVQAANDTATVTITGKVLANTCTLVSKAKTVTLADISDRDIQGAGKTGGEKKIDILLEDCGESSKSVTVVANGTPYGGSDDAIFKNTSADNPAAGVGLYFFQSESGKDKFKPDGSVTQDYPLEKGNNTLSFRASYVGTGDDVTAGNFQSVVNLAMTYN